MNTNAKSSGSQRFNDYLDSLQEAFKSNATSMTSPSARRFSICLGQLKGEFELMSLEIETLGRERDEYKVKVENGCPKICDRCSNEMASASQIGVSSGATSMKNTVSLFSRPFFRFKSRDKPTSSRRLDHIQETTTRRPTEKLPAVITPISHSRPSDSNLESQERKWSITYNSEVKRELDIELAHVFRLTMGFNQPKFSKEGKRLAVGCADGKVSIYDVETGILTCVLGNLLKGDERIGTAVCFSGDGNHLATSAWDGKIYIWEMKPKYIQKAFRGHTGPCSTLEFSPNGRFLVSASQDNTVRLWNMRDGFAKFLTNHNPTFIDFPYYHGANFSPDGEYVAASHRDGIVRIWDVRTCRLMRRVISHSIGWSVKFMPDGKGLVSGGGNYIGDDATLKSWDVSSLNSSRLHVRVQKPNGLGGDLSGLEEQTMPQRVFSGHERTVTSVAVSRDGIWIASGSLDTSVRIWSTRNAAMHCTLNNAYEGGTLVGLSPAGVHLASGGIHDDLVRIWKYTRRGGSQVRIGH